MSLQAEYEKIGEELDTEEQARKGRPKKQEHCDFRGCENKHYARGLCQKHYKQERKQVQGAGKKAAKPGRPSLWLEKKEAEIISKAIQYGILVRYGTEPEIPTEQAQEHLAHLIKKYSQVFPLSFVQGFIRKLMPIGDPSAKPGRSSLGDLVQFIGGWHQQNPDLYQEILGAEGVYIPFIMEPPTFPPMAAPEPVKIPHKREVENIVGRTLTTNEYLKYLEETYGVITHKAGA